MAQPFYDMEGLSSSSGILPSAATVPSADELPYTEMAFTIDNSARSTPPAPIRSLAVPKRRPRLFVTRMSVRPGRSMPSAFLGTQRRRCCPGTRLPPMRRRRLRHTLRSVPATVSQRSRQRDLSSARTPDFPEAPPEVSVSGALSIDVFRRGFVCTPSYSNFTPGSNLMADMTNGALGVAHRLPQPNAGASKLGLELPYLRSCGASH